MGDNAPRRTVLLTERVPRRVRLAPADVDFLLARHAADVELTPTGRRGAFRLTPGGRAGVVVTPTRRLVIRPKIPLQNLFFLLDPDAPSPAGSDESAPAPGAEALHFLAGRLARLMEERVAAGLRRGYREQSDRGPILQGRVDVAAQLREAPGRKDQLHSRYDDWTADVPCNRAPTGTAELLLASPLLGEPVRAALRRALRGFDGVTPAAPTPEAFAAAEADRLAEGYRPLLDLCRLLAEGLAPGEASGPTACPAFLLDTDRVFERYVTRGVAAAFADGGRWAAAVQEPHAVTRAADGRPPVEMRPDVTLYRDGRPALVLDAKWKRPAGAPASADLYQMLAYCAGLGVGRAVLVYPGRRDRVRTLALLHTPFAVEVRTLRVTALPERCRRSLRRLARSLAVPPGRA
jgi:5-methylcytosine-specific restriction enzyme subunit McrC